MRRILYFYFLLWPILGIPLASIDNIALLIFLVSMFIIAFIASYPKIQTLIEEDLTKKFGYLMPYPPYITDRINSMKRNNLIMLGISYLFVAYMPFRFKDFDLHLIIIMVAFVGLGLTCPIFLAINLSKYRILKKYAKENPSLLMPMGPFGKKQADQ